MKRLSIWSGPRNVSTALMYAFRSRSDTIVFDEPLYAHYLAVSGAPHPGREEVLESMDSDGERVVREVLLGDAPPAGQEAMPPGTRVRMYKNMAHHLRGLSLDLFAGLEHALLTRDPREMLPSLARNLPEPTLADTGLSEQVALLSHELSAGRTPVVLDATRLRQEPEAVLRSACRRWGLAWDPAMLTWPPGPKGEDGVWAPYWYANVHASTGFAPYRPPEAPVPGHLRALLERCQPLYARLVEHAV